MLFIIYVWIFVGILWITLCFFYYLLKYTKNNNFIVYVVFIDGNVDLKLFSFNILTLFIIVSINKFLNIKRNIITLFF